MSFFGEVKLYLKAAALTIWDQRIDVMAAFAVPPMKSQLHTSVAPLAKHSRWLAPALVRRHGLAGDGATLYGPVPVQAWAKYAIPKGLPAQGGRSLAIENDPHTLEGFSGIIEEGYGKGTKLLLYQGQVIVKTGRRTFPALAEYHVHDADRAGIHYDLAVQGVNPGTRRFEVHVPTGDQAGRYAFHRTQQGMLVVAMNDRGVRLDKNRYRLTPQAELAKYDPKDWIAERKLDGCFRADAPVLCWDGKVTSMKAIVDDGLDPVLVGFDAEGEPVPCRVVNRFRNGKKRNWIEVALSNPVTSRGGSGFGRRRRQNVMEVTDNHVVWLDGQERPVGSAECASRMVSVQFSPSPSVLKLMRAGLLGDGSLVQDSRGYQTMASYQENHKVAHLGYVEDMRRVLGACRVQASDSVSGFGSNMAWLRTRVYPCLAKLREEWYPRGVKRPPMNLSWMDDAVVAKWYMDDGSLCHNHSQKQQDRATFSTNAFTKVDCQRLANKIHEMYGIDTKVRHSKGWFIAVNATPLVHPQPGVCSSEEGRIDEFWRRIALYVHPCMRYKLPERYRDVPWTQWSEGTEEVVAVESSVMSVRMPTGRPMPREAYDIGTTTGNYVCFGVKVHNSWATASLHEGRAAFRSHRGGEAVTYYDRLPAVEFVNNTSSFLLARTFFPGPMLDGTVFKGELTHPDGYSRVSGIVNSLPGNARRIQTLRGPVDFYVWDIARYKGRDVSHLPYEQRRALYLRLVGEIRTFNHHWHAVDAADGDFGVFYDEVVSDPLPFGEGIVLKRRLGSAEETWPKVKRRDFSYFQLVSIEEGHGKYAGSAGKMVVANPQNGALGEVGSLAVTDEHRQWLFAHRQQLAGQTVKVLVQDITDRGAPRAGVYVGLHGEGPLLMYAESLAGGDAQQTTDKMYAIKSSAGWRKA